MISFENISNIRITNAIYFNILLELQAGIIRDAFSKETGIGPSQDAVSRIVWEGLNNFLVLYLEELHDDSENG